MKNYNVKYDWEYPEIGTRVAQKKKREDLFSMLGAGGTGSVNG